MPRRGRGRAERRVDPSDGNAYTKQEFLDFYGTEAEWAAAAGTASNADEGQSKQQAPGRAAPRQAAVSAEAPAAVSAEAPAAAAGGGSGERPARRRLDASSSVFRMVTGIVDDRRAFHARLLLAAPHFHSLPLATNGPRPHQADLNKSAVSKPGDANLKCGDAALKCTGGSQPVQEGFGALAVTQAQRERTDR